MKRTTLLVLSTVALFAGCRDEPPPPAPASSEAPAAADHTATGAGKVKLRPGLIRPVMPGARRNVMEIAEDAGAEGDAGADAAAPAPARVFSFDKDKADEAPPGFDFANSAGKPGKWRVVADPAAPSAPNVLAQLDGDKTDARFLTAIAAEPSLRDVLLAVRCKPVSGKVDQSCGLVVRFKDAKNYYVARANALEKNVNLYVVKDGKRTLLGGWGGATFADAWHDLRLEAKGDHLVVLWDGTRVYETDDKTFPDAGRIGLWTKADSVTRFDELSVTAL